MAFKYSQTLLKAILGKQEVKIVEASATANEDISLTDGGAGADSIDGGSAVDFVAAGFKKGDSVYVLKASDSADDIEGVTVTAVTATKITLSTGVFTTGESGSTAIIVLAADGGSIKNLLNNLNLTIFTGTQPDDPDKASTQKGSATPLITYYNFFFGTAIWNSTDAQAELPLAENVAATADNTGTATWCRVWKGESADAATNRDAENATSLRMDGSVGVTTGDYRVSSTSFESGVGQTFNNFKQFIRQLGVSI